MKAIKVAAALTAYYSDSKDPKVNVKYGRRQFDKSISIAASIKPGIEKLGVGKD